MSYHQQTWHCTCGYFSVNRQQHIYIKIAFFRNCTIIAAHRARIYSACNWQYPNNRIELADQVAYRAVVDLFQNYFLCVNRQVYSTSVSQARITTGFTSNHHTTIPRTYTCTCIHLKLIFIQSLECYQLRGIE